MLLDLLQIVALRRRYFLYLMTSNSNHLSKVSFFLKFAHTLHMYGEPVDGIEESVKALSKAFGIQARCVVLPTYVPTSTMPCNANGTKCYDFVVL